MWISWPLDGRGKAEMILRSAFCLTSPGGHCGPDRGRQIVPDSVAVPTGGGGWGFHPY